MTLPTEISDAINGSPIETIITHLTDSITSATTFDLLGVTDLQPVTPEDMSAFELPLRSKPVTANHKRGCDEFIASSSEAQPFSSDPPLFSSDDLPASSAENYLQHRHKRQQRRAWYEDEERTSHVVKRSPTKAPRARGPFTRKYDSAVWLGSDEDTENEEEPLADLIPKISREKENGGTDDGKDEAVPGACSAGKTLIGAEAKQAGLLAKAMQNVEDPAETQGPIFPYWQTQPKNLKEFHLFQDAAAKKVLGCVEAGEEVLDLSSMHLNHIRAPTLKPLRHYVKQDRRACFGSPSTYHSLTPAIRLFLSNNSLDQVPSELYHLENLRVLSLRSNNITDILPSIRNLTKLREFNLGSNQLRYFPFELLDLLAQGLDKFNFYPNPLLRPCPSLWGCSVSPPIPFSTAMDHIASTLIAYLDTNGSSMRNYPPAPSSLPSHWPERNSKPPIPPQNTINKTPSLLELSLRACFASQNLSQLPFLLPPSTSPNLISLLKHTFHLKEAGGQKCSVCGSDYIIPRTEWLEWWYIRPWTSPLDCSPKILQQSHRPVPFLRRGCSWACVAINPKAMIRGWTGARDLTANLSGTGTANGLDPKGEDRERLYDQARLERHIREGRELVPLDATWGSDAVLDHYSLERVPYTPRELRPGYEQRSVWNR